MSVSAETATRIELRTSVEKKQLLKDVAKMCGLSMTDFILTISVEKAQERLKEFASMNVNLGDYNRMMEALDNSPEPTEPLKKALKQFKKGASFEL